MQTNNISQTSESDKAASSSPTPNTAASVPNMTPEVAKKKCKNFLSTLLKLAVHQPPDVAHSIKQLIQGLVDNNVTPEQFTTKLQNELKSSDQPCLTPFLKKSLPYLQLSLCQGEIFIEGIKPPSLQALLMKPGNVEQMQSLIAAISTYRNPNSGPPISNLAKSPAVNYSQGGVVSKSITAPSGGNNVYHSPSSSSYQSAPQLNNTNWGTPPNPKVIIGAGGGNTFNSPITAGPPPLNNNLIQQNNFGLNVNSLNMHSNASSQNMGGHNNQAAAILAAKNALATKQLLLQNLNLLSSGSASNVNSQNVAIQLQNQLQLLQSFGIGLPSSQSSLRPPLHGVASNNNVSAAGPAISQSVQQSQFALKPIQLPPMKTVDSPKMSTNYQQNTTSMFDLKAMQPNVVLTPTTTVIGSNKVGSSITPTRNGNAQTGSTSQSGKRSDTSANTTGSLLEPPTSPLRDDDDINDVAAMGGVNLSEEKQRILASSSDLIGFKIRSCQDETYISLPALQNRLQTMIQSKGITKVDPEVYGLLCHALEYRLKVILSKLSVIAEHRQDAYKMDPKYEIVSDVKAQLKFLEEIDSMEKRRKDEEEKEMMFRLAKRAKHEDPDQLKLKQKVKEMQLAQVEEMRQMEANMTALAAIGPRKKKINDETNLTSVSSETMQHNRPRNKRVALKDLLFLLEQERETCRSDFLYKLYLR